MPKYIENPVSIQGSTLNFSVEFARVKDLYNRIYASEYGIKKTSNNMKEYLIKRLDKIDPNPVRETKATLDRMKEYYKKYLKETCKHLAVLMHDNNECNELLQFSAFFRMITIKLFKKDTESSWDALYNLSEQIKNVGIDYPQFKAVSTLRSAIIEPALDRYFEQKEAKETAKVEQEAQTAVKEIIEKEDNMIRETRANTMLGLFTALKARDAAISIHTAQDGSYHGDSYHTRNFKNLQQSINEVVEQKIRLN